jgi:acyl-CoA synthetase (AMP-forming)/AMP-acid ligase II
LVRDFCLTRLSLHKVPRIVKLIESIPLDERGKVKRAALALL